jgi:hypothetical protein
MSPSAWWQVSVKRELSPALCCRLREDVRYQLVGTAEAKRALVGAGGSILKQQSRGHGGERKAVAEIHPCGSLGLAHSSRRCTETVCGELYSTLASYLLATRLSHTTCSARR